MILVATIKQAQYSLNSDDSGSERGFKTGNYQPDFNWWLL